MNGAGPENLAPPIHCESIGVLGPSNRRIPRAYAPLVRQRNLVVCAEESSRLLSDNVNAQSPHPTLALKKTGCLYRR